MAYRFERFKESFIVSDLANWDTFCRSSGQLLGARIGWQFVRLIRIAERTAMGAAEALVPLPLLGMPEALRTRIGETHPCRKG